MVNPLDSISVLNQYETALQLMNSEIQKLLISNDKLQKENLALKQMNESLPKHGMNTDNVWINGQLKDAKAQIQDLRNVNQNLHI